MSKRSRIKNSILESNSEELRRSPEKAVLRDKNDITDEERKKRAQKNGRLYIWCVIGISLALAAFIIMRGIITINERLTSELVIYDTDISGVADGTYDGEFTSAHMSAQVSVEIASGKMTAIQLDSYTGIDARRAREVFDIIIRYQTLVPPDNSIGGEHTDKIIQRAVMEALSQAVDYTARSRVSEAQQGESVPYIAETPELAV